MKTPFQHRAPLLSLIIISMFFVGCATMLKTTELQVPTPISDNSGKYLSPFTSDGTIAPWVTKGTAAKLGAAAGGYVGRKAGEKALEQVPFIGGLLGRKAGRAIGKATAMKLVGGEEYMRETSDLSFNEVDDLIVFLYSNYTTHDDWEKVYDLTKSIYPEVETRWAKAIKRARQS